MGRLGGGRGRFTVEGDSQHQHRRARAVFSEGGRLFLSLCCRMTQLDPRLAGKADGAVQFRIAAGIFQNISCLKIFFFFFIQKEGAVGKGSGFICL